MHCQCLSLVVPTRTDDVALTDDFTLLARQGIAIPAQRPQQRSALLAALLLHILLLTCFAWYWPTQAANSPPLIIVELIHLPETVVPALPVAQASAPEQAEAIKAEEGPIVAEQEAETLPPEPTVVAPPPLVAVQPVTKKDIPRKAVKKVTTSAAPKEQPRDHSPTLPTGETTFSPLASPSPLPPDSAPLSQAAYLDNPKPIYPPFARKQGRQGTVLLLVVVESNGHPAAVQLKQSSGSELLDQAAIAAVKEWRFVPAYRHGMAVRESVEIPIRFHLDKP